MKPELAASFIAAVIFHALLLFGFRMGTSAHPQAMSDELSAVGQSVPPAVESKCTTFEGENGSI
jgi:hypothetical protein